MNKICVFSIILLLSSNLVFAEDAQLVLIRDSGSDLVCEQNVVHGSLYGVPSSLSLDSVSSSIGLEFLTKTQELPYEDNATDRSAIPKGTYAAEIRTDETKSWMKGNPLRAWRLQLLDTGKRTAIQFHYGKDYKWSSGCIILSGDENHPLVCKDGAENSPDFAVKKVKDYVLARVRNSSDKIAIKIISNN